MDAQATLQHVLETVPGSMRQLAIEAGVSESLLRAIRDGNRRMTTRTRDRLVEALRTWGDRCHDLSGLLEAAQLEEGEDHG